ncbi:hypothetical protein ACVWXN_006161 [Bradyrhizobium sp. i1.4.4]
MPTIRPRGDRANNVVRRHGSNRIHAPAGDGLDVGLGDLQRLAVALGFHRLPFSKNALKEDLAQASDRFWQ